MRSRGQKPATEPREARRLPESETPNIRNGAPSGAPSPCVRGGADLNIARGEMPLARTNKHVIPAKRAGDSARARVRIAGGRSDGRHVHSPRPDFLPGQI